MYLTVPRRCFRKLGDECGMNKKGHILVNLGQFEDHTQQVSKISHDSSFKIDYHDSNALRRHYRLISEALFDGAFPPK